MEDWLKCQISPLVKYRQNQNQNTIHDVFISLLFNIILLYWMIYYSEPYLAGCKLSWNLINVYNTKLAYP